MRKFSPKSARTSRSYLAVSLLLSALILIGAYVPTAEAANTTAPTTTVSYHSFFGATYNLYPWFGQKVVLLTTDNTLDVPTMNNILSALDAAFGVYEQITGGDPSAFPPDTLNGRDTIAEVPDGATCGAGCTNIGANGGELMTTFFLILYNGVKNNGEYDQVLFYEFGRSFWFYGNQLGTVDPFVTGFAIANRFISIDRIGIKGGPFNVLPYADFERSILVDLLNTYLADPSFTWRNTLLINQAPPTPHGWSAADLAGSMFHRIYEDFGLQAYGTFFRTLQQLPAANTPEDVIRNFLSAAQTATGQYYGFLFKDIFNGPPVVGDHTPSVISGMPGSGCTLWPPNGDLVQVAIVRATDSQSGVASFVVTGVSNEPAAPGVPDIVINGTGLQPRAIQLRADRFGSGTGRIYALTATSTDQAGNTAKAQATCIVPHDQR